MSLITITPYDAGNANKRKVTPGTNKGRIAIVTLTNNWCGEITIADAPVVTFEDGSGSGLNAGIQAYGVSV
ncbi:MAG: hypothetical protein HRT35_24000, partial [Algicola sp.]|nr:hypothetical protein [Algicola sp.]